MNFFSRKTTGLFRRCMTLSSKSKFSLPIDILARRFHEMKPTGDLKVLRLQDKVGMTWRDIKKYANRHHNRRTVRRNWHIKCLQQSSVIPHLFFALTGDGKNIVIPAFKIHHDTARIVFDLKENKVLLNELEWHLYRRFLPFQSARNHHKYAPLIHQNDGGGYIILPPDETAFVMKLKDDGLEHLHGNSYFSHVDDGCVLIKEEREFQIFKGILSLVIPPKDAANGSAITGRGPYYYYDPLHPNVFIKLNDHKNALKKNDEYLFQNFPIFTIILDVAIYAPNHRRSPVTAPLPPEAPAPPAAPPHEAPTPKAAAAPPPKAASPKAAAAPPHEAPTPKAAAPPPAAPSLSPKAAAAPPPAAPSLFQFQPAPFQFQPAAFQFQPVAPAAPPHAPKAASRVRQKPKHKSRKKRSPLEYSPDADLALAERLITTDQLAAEQILFKIIDSKIFSYLTKEKAYKILINKQVEIGTRKSFEDALKLLGNLFHDGVPPEIMERAEALRISIIPKLASLLVEENTKDSLERAAIILETIPNLDEQHDRLIANLKQSYEKLTPKQSWWSRLTSAEPHSPGPNLREVLSKGPNLPNLHGVLSKGLLAYLLLARPHIPSHGAAPSGVGQDTFVNIDTGATSRGLVKQDQPFKFTPVSHPGRFSVPAEVLRTRAAVSTDATSKGLVKYGPFTPVPTPFKFTPVPPGSVTVSTDGRAVSTGDTFKKPTHNWVNWRERRVCYPGEDPALHEQCLQGDDPALLGKSGVESIVLNIKGVIKIFTKKGDTYKHGDETLTVNGEQVKIDGVDTSYVSLATIPTDLPYEGQQYTIDSTKPLSKIIPYVSSNGDTLIFDTAKNTLTHTTKGGEERVIDDHPFGVYTY